MIILVPIVEHIESFSTTAFVEHHEFNACFHKNICILTYLNYLNKQVLLL